MDSLICGSQVHNILTTVMTNIVIDQSTDSADATFNSLNGIFYLMVTFYKAAQAT